MVKDFFIHKFDITIKIASSNMLEVSWYGFVDEFDVDGTIFVQIDDGDTDLLDIIEKDMYPMRIGDNSSVGVYLKNKSQYRNLSKDACPMLKKMLNDLSNRTRKLYFSGFPAVEIDM